MEQTVLNVKNLSVRFKSEDGPVTAVDGISFQVRQGELLGIVGESGCGKSQTSLAVMGLTADNAIVEADALELMGKDISHCSKEERRKLRGKEMSMIFQEPLTSLNPLLTVGFQISEILKIHENLSRQERKARAIEMIRKVGIPRPEAVYNMYPSSLSGGMRQRVMIAIALACNPRLLIADEPTTALDVTIQAQILSLMRDLMKEYQTAIMFITHDLGVVAEMVDRVLVMYAGQIVEESDVFELFRHPLHPYTQGLLNSTIKVHELEDNLLTIEGTVPSIKAMPSGCRFHPRCPYAVPSCAEQMPALTEVTPGHKVRCPHCQALEKEES